MTRVPTPPRAQRSELLTDSVMEAIRQRIEDGTYQPEEHIVAFRIAREMGVSQWAAQTALQELDRSGWLVSGDDGSMVAPRSTDEDLIALRLASFVQAEAARRLAESTVLSQLRSEEEPDTLDAHLSFRQALVAACDSLPLLAQVWDALGLKIRLMHTNVSDAAFRANDEALDAAIRAGDKDLAERLASESYDAAALNLASPIRSGIQHRLVLDAGRRFSSPRVSRAIQALTASSRAALSRNWLSAIAALVTNGRPDLAPAMVDFLGVTPSSASPLRGMSMGEIGVVYEALVALLDSGQRRINGQYFTPDDVAAFMASQALRFPAGNWLDPCCGVGNLAWHLAAVQSNPAEFVSNHLTLIDIDPVALKTAAALLVAGYAAEGDTSALHSLWSRCYRRDFLSETRLPAHDYTIVNPPYGRTDARRGYRTESARELFAYFLERIATTSKGFVSITPASFLGLERYAALREILDERSSGSVMVFDNVPDTIFRGYKYGSSNTSKTNFVRAAITVVNPQGEEGWRVTPIIRWSSRSRERMFRGTESYLTPRRVGPGGEWAKIMPGTEAAWDALADSPRRIGDLVTSRPTDFHLDVASTPRYYISASKRVLDRGSKHTLYFASQQDMDAAYLVLNSSLPYWWWRTLDGGITLPIRNLLSVPVPAVPVSGELLAELELTEAASIVTKLNAGRENENVRRPADLVARLDAWALPDMPFDFEKVYTSDLFATPN